MQLSGKSEFLGCQINEIDGSASESFASGVNSHLHNAFGSQDAGFGEVAQGSSQVQE